MADEQFDVVIVGGGHAGAQCAIALRQANFEASIAIVSEELEYPYERPPLSKEYLSKEKSFERILLRPPTFWESKLVTMRLGHRVASVDAAARIIVTEDGKTIGYGKLVWATGGRPRRIDCAGHHFSGIHTVRNREDVDRIEAELPKVTQAVVIGGGYIGLEAAAVLAKFGKKVVLLEALDRVLARVAGEELSRFYEAEHRAHGVDLRLETKVEAILGPNDDDNGRVTGVRLKGGEVVEAQMVIVGIGIIPAVEPLLAAGAKGGNGVLVNERCHSSLQHVFAIGDCALHANAYADGATIRLESVQNANDQANIVAKTIVGADVQYDAVPWFWSNQYDLKLQTVGLSIGYDEAILRGDPANRSFSVIYRRQGKVIAIDCVNAIKDYVQGKKLIVEGVIVSAAALADADTPLKQLA